MVHSNNTAFTNGSMFVAEMKLEEGNVATDWSPSPYDLASETELTTVEETINGIKTTVQKKADISQLNQTADSLTAKIGNANNDISSLKQRANSIETNISNNKKDISSLKQTANSLQSNIQSKADISQVTQLSNVIQSTVQTIGPVVLNGDFTDTDPTKYYIPWDTTKDYRHLSINQKMFWLDINGTRNETWKYMYKNYILINPRLPLIFSGSAKLNWGSGSLVSSAYCYLHFYDSSKNEIGNILGYYLPYDNNNVWQNFSYTVDANTTPKGTVYMRFELSLEVGGSSNTVWLSVDNLNVSNGGDTVSSKISQLSNDINLRVQKGNLISQINVEAGKTLIQSKNLYLDSDTVIFSGRAFIPSAAITDLSADKITAGTLNAGNVNVINLDVNKLVGNTTEFVRSGWTNAYGSHVQIDGGGMSVRYGDWNTRFNSGGVLFNIGDQDIGGYTVRGMEGMPSWYQGLSLTTGADAEYFTIGAKDYHNKNQSPIPTKLVWMRKDVNGAGYNPGWNFNDDVWVDRIHPQNLIYDNYTVKFTKYNNGALALISSQGSGFYWSSDGNDAGIIINNVFHSFKNKKIPTNIDSSGTVTNWENW